MQIINYSFRSRILASDIPSTTYMTHGLYSYPAKFIPHVPYYIITNYTLKEGMLILDPFGGSATTAIEALKQGHNCIIMDNNPITDLLSYIKTTQLDFTIENHETSTMPLVDIEMIINKIKSYPGRFIPSWKNIDHWIEPEFKPFIEQIWGYINSNPDSMSETLLTLLKITALHVTDYFSNGALDVPKLFKSKNRIMQIERLKERYQTNPDLPYSLLIKRFMRNYHMINEFDEYISRKGIKILHFNKLSNLNLARLSNNERFVVSMSGVDSIHYHFPKKFIHKIDMIITSPPYVYAQEYIRSSKSHLYWLDIIDDKKATELTRTEIGHRKDLDIQDILTRMEGVPSFISTFNTLIDKEGVKYGKNGKYTPLIANYFSDMHYFIQSMKTILRKGGIFGFFIGNPTVLGIQISCNEIFKELFEDLDYEILEYGYDHIITRQLLKGRKNDSPEGMDNEWLIIAKNS